MNTDTTNLQSTDSDVTSQIVQFDLSEPIVTADNTDTKDIIHSERSVQFIRACNGLQNELKDIESKIEDLRIRVDSLSVSSTASVDSSITNDGTFQTHNQYSQLLSAVSSRVRTIQILLQGIVERVKILADRLKQTRLQEAALGHRRSPQFRQQAEVHLALSRRLRSQLQSFQALQLHARHYIRQRVRRVVRVAGRAQEADQGQGALRVMRSSVDGILSAAMAHHSESEVIGRGIAEIRQLTLDAELLVEQGSRNTDRIAFHVAHSGVDIEEGLEQVTKASQRRRRRGPCVACCICALVIFGVVAAYATIVAIRVGKTAL
eukprot:gnl/Dysnectes_brevis/8869_a16107_113.p1 GENE.gnl/Dysnectes_brevis/8869_a16107_113~~gnl/Dysnectes_brevis/8869_a16107_113.p1  ORF type:complete len:320 (+),score=76.95 gnl/Dysnectes_brevis/8869_a16107_113:260-1219(+)